MALGATSVAGHLRNAGRNEPLAPGRHTDAVTARSRFSFAGLLAGVLALALLATAGWVAYSYLLTDEPAQERQQAAVAQLEDGGLVDGAPTAGEPAWLLRIPRFGTDWVMPVLGGTEDDQLNSGVGWTEGSGVPGEHGNVVLIGHRITHGEPFRQLLTLEVGDEVILETASATYTYVIHVAPADLTVDADDSWVLDQLPGGAGHHPSEELLTLITAQDLFWSPDRAVGFAHLVGTEPH
ncbi:class E sortase [Parenemella sanctibonifatiensis]|uniref:Class E sortase n=1 Tax=Parenemella sanctibonifatiensis TaxID=2016505 RepID=A0A255EB17_9ACTN|nr:class E sortase [Parenemella sanctibonifatiensis]